MSILNMPVITAILHCVLSFYNAVNHLEISGTEVKIGVHNDFKARRKTFMFPRMPKCRVIYINKGGNPLCVFRGVCLIQEPMFSCY